MQSRTIREGSVGLLIILGVSLFGLLILWLRGLQLGSRTYNLEFEFADAMGLEAGSPVQFRGVEVGKVTEVKPGANGIVLKTKIDSAGLLIPRNVLVEANQSGFIGQAVVDLTPQQPLPSDAVANLGPFESNCDPKLILCNGDRLPGEVGVSYDELVRAAVRLADLLDDPTLIGNLNQTLKSVSTAATGLNQLSQDARVQLAGVSTTTRSLTNTANQVSSFARTSERTVTRVGSELTQASDRVGNAADQVGTLVVGNRGTLVTTLDNLNQSSRELRVVVRNLAPAVNRVTQGELIQNLETLSANAAQASANLRDVSAEINSPTNLLVLQQTLDAARVTFQNTQKITTDLDELTGDPAFRKNLRDLVNGLSGLVSSTQELDQHVQVARSAQFPEPVTPIVLKSKPTQPDQPAKRN